MVQLKIPTILELQPLRYRSTASPTVIFHIPQHALHLLFVRPVNQTSSTALTAFISMLTLANVIFRRTRIASETEVEDQIDAQL